MDFLPKFPGVSSPGGAVAYSKVGEVPSPKLGSLEERKCLTFRCRDEGQWDRPANAAMEFEWVAAFVGGVGDYAANSQL